MRNVHPDHQVGGYRAFAPADDLAFAVEAAWTHYAATDDVRAWTLEK